MPFVYIAPLKDASAFKIGKAISPSARISQLCRYYDFDLMETIIVNCGTVGNAFSLEVSLHKLFETKRVFMPHDGGTEFFSYDIYDEVIKITRAVCEINSYDIVQYVRDRENSPIDEVELIVDAFSAKIRARRLEMDFSQAHLAQLAGVSLKTIHLIEKNCKSGFYNVVSVLRALDLEYLFGELEIAPPLRQRASRSKDQTE